MQDKLLTITYIDVSDLKENSWNTNHVTPQNEEKLKNSLIRYGFKRPLIARRVDDQLELIGGEHRLKIAKSLGYKQVPVIVFDDMSDQTAKEVSLLDNSRYGEDDTLELSALLSDLSESVRISDYLPYSEDQLHELFSFSDMDFETLEVPLINDPRLDEEEDEQVSKKTKTSQIFRFKVPIGDADFIEKIINETMRVEGFTQEDSLSNAGHALIHLLKQVR